MMQIRASGAGNIMAYHEKPELGEGAKSYINDLASQIIFEWQDELDINTFKKGIAVEDDSIALLNRVKNKQYVKNKTRLTSDLFTGEWDIYDPDEDAIIDIKSAYSKKSFPLFIKEKQRKLYEWQLDTYMLLKDASKSAIVYALVDTPDELIGRFDNPENHKVSRFRPDLRITELWRKRDATRERQLIAKAKAAQRLLFEILDKRGYDWGAIESDTELELII
jgi:hypothetical protein